MLLSRLISMRLGGRRCLRGCSESCDNIRPVSGSIGDGDFGFICTAITILGNALQNAG